MPSRSLVLWLCLALCACVGGERVKLDAKSPAPPKSAPMKPVAISVSDDREEVKRGDKKEWYLGEAPSGDKELSNHQLVPLHAQLRDDLSDELKSLGFDVVSENKVRKLEVSIREWRYDADASVLRYRVEARVLERDDGAVLAQSMLGENVAIGETDEKKTKAALKAAYVAVVRKIIRENATILSALQR
jgi:hypothetical protein